MPWIEDRAEPAVGLAYNGWTGLFLDRHAGLVDYVEIPFELLSHDPGVLEIGARKPIVLHCASLSIGGTVPCPADTLSKIQEWVGATATPWLGEHLAYVTADCDEANAGERGSAPSEPYDIGYTISPPMNERALERVCRNVDRYLSAFPVPLLLENSPLYFSLPTSTMSQSRFLHQLCERTGVGLLLDLSHFHITMQNLGLDPEEELSMLPLERVVEMHLSGIEQDDTGVWDDHSRPAPEIIYELLAIALERACPRAVTLEYNWSVAFPHNVLQEEVEKTRDHLGRKTAARV